MLDPALDDDAKEQAVRRAAFDLLLGSGSLAWRFAVTLLAAAVPIYLGDWAGWVPLEDSFALILDPVFLISVTALAVAVRWMVRRHQSTPSSDTAYSASDKVLHALAFSGPGMLRRMARLDQWIFRRTIEAMPATRPIFVTSLARGGTTALLNALDALPAVATHRYRDMPFVTAPLLWSKLGGGSRRKVATRLRAHGDGLSISLDSPEAFDEVYWQLLWPEKYTRDKIILWSPEDQTPESTKFIATQFEKLVRLRGGPQSDRRYVSKNNANIARLSLLPEMFPDCEIIIPLRRPGPHAASLLRQHRNFLDLHARDAFAERYMRDIGHLEFGALHRPIGFEGFNPQAHDTMNPDYWLGYWIAAFSYVRSCPGRYHFVLQDTLRAQPEETMRALCQKLSLPTEDQAFADFFHSDPDPEPENLFSPDLLNTANTLYQSLISQTKPS